MIQHDKKVHVDNQKQEQIISNEIQSDVEKTGQYVVENNDQVAVNLQQEDSQKGIENFVEEALPKEIGVEESNKLQATQAEAINRTEAERNMPQSHVSISEAKMRLSTHGKTFGDSEKMTLMKNKTEALLSLLSEKVATLVDDDEFEKNLGEVNQGYDELIVACQKYVKKAGKPIFQNGKDRLLIVKGILLQATSERKMIADSARRLRRTGLKGNKGAELYSFADVLSHVAVNDGALENETISDVTEESTKKVLASRFATCIGAGNLYDKADIKTMRRQDGSLHDVVSITKQEKKDQKKLEADRQANTRRILDAILTNKPQEEMRALLTEINRSPLKADRDILNNLLTTDVQELLGSFGSLYDEAKEKALRESLSLFYKEIKASGLSKSLELYDRTGETSVTVSDFSWEERHHMRTGRGNNIYEQDHDNNEIIREPVTDPMGALVIPEGKIHMIDHSQKEPHRVSKYWPFLKWVDKRDDPLFQREPSLNDINQGAIGDCFFMTAIGNLVQYSPKAVKDMMKDNGDGTVTVRFFQFDNTASEKLTPVYVKIKKSVVKIKGTSFNYFARGGNGLWVRMLEKAYVCSGLAANVATKLEELKKQNNDTIPNLDYDKHRNLKLLASESTLDDKRKDKKNLKRARYETLNEGGFQELVLPLLTGKYMKATELEDANLYVDEKYKRDKSKEQKRQELFDSDDNFEDTLPMYPEMESNEHLRDLVRRHDEKKNKENNDADHRIDRVAEGQPATVNERSIILYEMCTGKKVNEENEDNAMFFSYFIKDFYKYYKDHKELAAGDKNPSEIFMKLIRAFTEEYKKDTKKRDPEWVERKRAFVGSEAYLDAVKWLLKDKRSAWDDKMLKYKRGTGKYYGQLTKIYDDIKKAIDDKRRLTYSIQEFNLKFAGGSKGLVGGHAYNVTGVTERKFGGKTYKFVIIRNPWGCNGTEYFYNPKTKKLDRRATKKITGGYTMVELSDFAMFGTDMSIEKKEAVGNDD